MSYLLRLLAYMPFLLFSYSCTALAEQQADLLIHAARVFDGTSFKTNTSVLIHDGKIAQVASRDTFKESHANSLDLGDATLLPGFIELHAHLNFQQIPAETVLQHGITTLRDVGGPVHPPSGGDGQLRVVTSGQIITAPNGYPIPQLGTNNIAIAVADEAQARQTVRQLIDGGAAVIKVALEPGNEHGVPWSSGHHSSHEHHHAVHAKSAQTMPLLSTEIVKAIVYEAHLHGRKVTVHVAEPKGVEIAINASVDEWAHIPCNPIPKNLLKRAVERGITIVSTLDTLSKCSGVAENARTWTALGGRLLYGAEIAHPDIPWGIDAQELNLMMQFAQLSPIEALQSATAKAGQQLNIPLLGTIQNGAPADLIAVKGDVMKNFKHLEYPALVISGGKIVVNQFIRH